MKNSSNRWKETLVLLGAGAQIVPLGNNRAVYRRLAERLECLQGSARPGGGACPPETRRFDWQRDA